MKAQLVIHADVGSYKKSNEMETNFSESLAKKNGSSFIRVSRGPQFRTKGGHFIALFTLTAFISAVYCLSIGEIFGAFAILIIGIFSFFIVLDIHVIEVDTKRHIIRDCKTILWIKIGRWSNIQDYRSVYLTRENVVIARDDESEYSTDTYHYYFVKIVDEKNRKEIVLAECNNYYKAQRVSKRIADLTGLTYRDFLHKPIKRN